MQRLKWISLYAIVFVLVQRLVCRRSQVRNGDTSDKGLLNLIRYKAKFNIQEEGVVESVNMEGKW
jgi:hypothetical protein